MHYEVTDSSEEQNEASIEKEDFMEQNYQYCSESSYSEEDQHSQEDADELDVESCSDVEID